MQLFGGYSGGQAEYMCVPYAAVVPFNVDPGIDDEMVLFLSDILGNIHPGDVVALWGAGPVRQFAVKSAFLLAAERVIAIDRVPARLRLAATASGAETINFDEQPVVERLKQLTGGRGPDACIDAVGLEAHGWGSLGAVYDRAKVAVRLATDRLEALRQAIAACRKRGTHGSFHSGRYACSFAGR